MGFRSVEEKRSLEILLKERPLDKAKLKQFCLRFTVPTKYRNFLWKVLLDVIPIYIDSHKFIISQRKAEFQDLQKALKVTKILDDCTKPHLMLLTMWLLRTRRAKLDMNTQLEVPLHRYQHWSHILLNVAINYNLLNYCLIDNYIFFRAMNRLAETLWHIVDIDSYEEKLVDTYWILCGLLDQVQKFHKEISRLQECTYTLLEREDPELYKHLIKIEALYNIPYDIWFSSCFAGTISNGSIAKYIYLIYFK